METILQGICLKDNKETSAVTTLELRYTTSQC